MTETEENELICEKLLGWRSMKADHDARLWCVPPTRGFTHPTPSFTTWSEVGPILAEMQGRPYSTKKREFVLRTMDAFRANRLTPNAIRDAVLEYLGGL